MGGKNSVGIHTGVKHRILTFMLAWRRGVRVSLQIPDVYKHDRYDGVSIAITWYGGWRTIDVPSPDERIKRRQL